MFFVMRIKNSNYILSFLVLISVLLFSFAVLIPHTHEESSLSNHKHNCSICRIQQGHSAADVKTVSIFPLEWVITPYLSPTKIHRINNPLLITPFSRAPPSLLSFCK